MKFGIYDEQKRMYFERVGCDLKVMRQLRKKPMVSDTTYPKTAAAFCCIKLLAIEEKRAFVKVLTTPRTENSMNFLLINVCFRFIKKLAT